jgi:hypothetical protein
VYFSKSMPYSLGLLRPPERRGRNIVIGRVECPGPNRRSAPEM